MQPTPFALTPFERNVVNLASQGFTNQEIAEKLDITK